ncbi:hypothetical protein [Bradyrhizobium sp.]|uniref:hypothetical protein n=1 Tax=Bradyrhizobium sp. TaxID=376 RepID=UPI0025C35B70|nr:hypothetical protein [Bradyrhizobium sp.]
MRAYSSGALTASNEFSRLKFFIAAPNLRLTGRMQADNTIRVMSPNVPGCYEIGFAQDPENFNCVPFDQFQIAHLFMQQLKPIQQRNGGVWAGDLASLADDWHTREQIHAGIETVDFYSYVRVGLGAIVLAAHTLGFPWWEHLGGAYISAQRASIRRIAREVGDDSW